MGSTPKTPSRQESGANGANYVLCPQIFLDDHKAAAIEAASKDIKAAGSLIYVRNMLSDLDLSLPTTFDDFAIQAYDIRIIIAARPAAATNSFIWVPVLVETYTHRIR